ncbi:La-related protein 6C [Choanephora cucurbitarum]|uniref:La-related protein 6C n=1 Tax=Choanephora cucurbitarum TaxID=101091 RepID=A0A1C7MY82_9FUNG|nr:La-related protein 6C [Choanephora cucurbitarum]
MTLEREHKLVKTVETLFSDASLLWDKVMQQKILADSENMVSFIDLSNLSKLKALDATPEEIKDCIERHSTHKLKLNEDQTKVGRIKPYVPNKKEELDDWSIYVEGLAKPYDDEQNIRELFNKLVGHVSFFRIPPNQQGQTKFFGYCFLEFDQQAHVQKAVETVNQYQVDSTEQTNELVKKLNLRVMSKHDWNKLKEEYVALLNQKKIATKRLWDEYNQGQQVEGEEEESFTKGLIVHVDGLHPQAPKTTALTLLETSGVKIAFMNQKKKGLTATHIRLDRPEDAQKICQFFDVHAIVQETEKDSQGKEQETKTSECIRLRILTGSEEKIYWQEDQKKQKKN